MSQFSRMIHIGLMSGTSCDGVDGVIAVFSEDSPMGNPTGLSRSVDILAQAHHPFDRDLQSRLHRLQAATFSPTEDPFELAALATNELVDVYSAVVAELCSIANLKPEEVCAIGCHGQTIRHRPELGYSLQLNNPARLVEQTGILTIADWRSRDIAAGGQGAPLVPAFHRWLFDHPTHRRVIVNLGGIANLTDLATGIGFDCGPANTLIDSWAMANLGQPIDRNGQWAQTGACLPQLLDAMSGDPFFARPSPKSTGRDYFCLDWIKKHLTGQERPEDVQATLTELTAVTIAQAIKQLPQSPTEILLCGGGVHNEVLVSALTRHLPVEPKTTAVAGLDPMLVEATAFAWLARQTQQGLPGNLPTATGASGFRCLGAIYPL